MLYKPTVALSLSVPKAGSRTDFINIQPQVISAKLTKNHHLIADELTVTIGWNEGGIDPREMKSSRGQFYLWDAVKYPNAEDNLEPHLQFVGIAHKVTRKASDQKMEVEMSFRDYTSLFLDMKPFPSAGMPKWTDSLDTIWKRICDNTGYKDPSTGKIVSNVEALKPNLIVRTEAARDKILGDIVHKRFHEISAPAPKTGSDAWAVWQWCVGSLGLISFIEGENCIITDTTEQFGQQRAAALIWGKNIIELEETAEAAVTNKGILVKGWDPVNWRVIEATFPKPDDDRLKVRRTIANRAAKENRNPSINELSADYEEFEMPWVMNQEVLDRIAESVYEQRMRQQIDGKIKTAEMVLFDKDGLNEINILELKSGDPLVVGIAEDCKDILTNFAGNENAALSYLINNLKYNRDLAELVLANIDSIQTKSPIFHVKTVQCTLEPDKFEVEIDYQNLIVTK